ncbi:MAG: cyclopropane-fatty-acyl-phospholipid synthase family protein [Acidobacteriaceae bacterium]
MTNSGDSKNRKRLRILDRLFETYSGAPFAIRTWDEWSWRSSENQSPVFTVIFRTRHALEQLFVDPSEWTLGEAFVEGGIDVEGDLVSAFDLLEHVLEQPLGWWYGLLQNLSAISYRILRLGHGRKHSRSGDRAAISYHYDQPPEFFLPWLGPSLVYSCAYFLHAEDSLDVAQKNKLDYICRKLRLQPGDRFLDIGCGWGSLILHAASEYQAAASGITLSQKQATVAVGRINRAHLQQRCSVQLCDYRTLTETPEFFDKIASVGMFEHVGRNLLPAYFQIAHSILRPGGVFLNHGIARSCKQQSRKHSFIDRYVFPNGELVPISEALQAAEQAGFEVRDVENLREHYAKTLRLWIQGLEAHKELALRYVPRSTFRIWKLYMAGSAAAFERGSLGVYQTLLCRPDRGRSNMPLTREDWYIDRATESVVAI